MSGGKQIYIREVGVREGLQLQRAIIPTKQKLELVQHLIDCGVPEIEVTAFVRPDRVPQMADARELCNQLPENCDTRLTALCLNERGFERASKCSALALQGWLYTAVSETFLANNNNTSHEKMLQGLKQRLQHFKKCNSSVYGIMISTAFGCNDEGVYSVQQLVDSVFPVLERLEELAAFPEELSLADTMGWGTPLQVRSAVEAFRERYPQLKLSLHLHDTRGLGMANVAGGLEAGVDCFESSLGGVGGCPFAPGAAGNVATEEIVYLCNRSGLATSIDLELLLKAVSFAATILGEQVLNSKLYRTGVTHFD